MPLLTILATQLENSANSSSSEVRFQVGIIDGQGGILDFKGRTMKLSLKLLNIAATALLLSISAHASTTVINGFAITSGTYSNTADWTAAVQAEFGASATVGSFESIETAFAGNTSGLASLLAGNDAYLTYNGNQYYSDTRAYFIIYHGSSVPGGWFVHDQIGSVATGNQISLGSWYGERRIVAYVGTVVPEPSSMLVAGVLGLGLVSRRRRTNG